jgi:hypothetical protein
LMIDPGGAATAAAANDNKVTMAASLNCDTSLPPGLLSAESCLPNRVPASHLKRVDYRPIFTDSLR